MKKIIQKRSLILISLLSPLLLHCSIATEQDVKNLDLRLRTMDNRLLSMDRNFSDLQEQTTTRANKNSVEALQKQQASTDNTVDQLRTQLLQIKGQLEENSHHYRNLQEDTVDYRDNLSIQLHDFTEAMNTQQSGLAELQKKVIALESRMNTLADQVKSNSDVLGKLKGDIAAEASSRAAEAARKAAQAALEAEEARLAAKAAREAEEARARLNASGRIPTLSPEKAKKPGSQVSSSGNETATIALQESISPAETLYNSGLAVFKQDKYKNASQIFTEFIEKYPKDKLRANAQYWLGDCLYNQDEFELAILEYQKVIDGHAGHSKVPAALFKQGLAFEELNDKGTARLVFQKLIDQFPGSKEATSAKSKLNK
ncbi:MAG: tol-pal system protein YbgF [Proteobacteria bacterium]|nr:tol-pal system protein YbgF [Pseudomonadota bacterium]MBU1686447.1 tol-pal system protein YbgF [Pseudomonadota bacterium]